MKRLAPPPDDRSPISTLQVNFGVPVHLTVDQERRLHAILDEIVDSPWNQPDEGVHWVSGSGSRPRWSRADKVDAQLLGVMSDPDVALDTPESGEPTFDDSVFFIETTARPFVSEREREKVMKRRQAEVSGKEVTKP